MRNQYVLLKLFTFCLSDAALNEGCPLMDRALINMRIYCPHRRTQRVVELYRANYSQSVENSLHHWLNEFYAVLPSFGEVKSSEDSMSANVQYLKQQKSATSLIYQG